MYLPFLVQFISLCRAKFVSYHFLLAWRTFFSVSCSAGLLAMILLAFIFWDSVFPPSLLKIFCWVKNFRLLVCIFPTYIFKDIIYLFLEKGEERQKERRETSIFERNIDGLPLSLPPTRERAATQAYALTMKLAIFYFAGKWLPTEPPGSGHIYYYIIYFSF